MDIVFIRHGMTKGNLEKRYIGVTEESLCGKGIQQLEEKAASYPIISNGAVLWSSPAKRCLQTASILFPNQKVQIESRLRECDFGVWEGKNYLELCHDREYQRWMASGGTLPFPNGEDVEQFKKRCVQAFLDIWNYKKERGSQTVVFVVHGGTIMAILEQLGYPKRGYYDYQCENGSGYYCRVERNLKKEIHLRIEKSF